MPIHLTLGHWATLHTLAAVLGVALYLLASRALRQKRQPSASIAWVLSLALIPYVALPVYLLVGGRKRGGRSRIRRSRTGQQAHGIHGLAHSMGLPAPSSCRNLSIHEDGHAALVALRTVIGQAREAIDVCTFLIGDDVLGRELCELLCARAREGVRVRLMVDGIGRFLGGRQQTRRLRDAGVEIAVFGAQTRLLAPGQFNLRNHRKMVSADGDRAWLGGRNLAAEYFVGDPTATPAKAAWDDLSFDFGGGLARQAQRQFEQDWAFATGAAAPPSPVIAPEEAPFAQLVPSGPDQTDDTYYSLLITSCFMAKTRILAVTPYFVPDDTLMMALTLAARRGVDVALVLPRRSNHRLADMARQSSLRELTQAGGEVWLTPGMIHAKACVFDDDLAFAGSANLDGRSLLLNYEIMVAFSDMAHVQRLAAWIERRRSTATHCTVERSGLIRELREGLVRALAFLL